MSDSKRFDEWDEVVDCNQCERYWLNQCDAVSKGSKIACTSFLATRSVVIPQEIKRLKTALKWLIASVIISDLALLILLLERLM